jgi:archaellum biogenesis protein FlaJ (TadC family)
LAQLAKLIHGSSHLFSAIKEKESLEEIKQLFNIVANDYWHYHYRFDEATEFLPKQLGESDVK